MELGVPLSVPAEQPGIILQKEVYFDILRTVEENSGVDVLPGDIHDYLKTKYEYVRDLIYTYSQHATIEKIREVVLNTEFSDSYGLASDPRIISVYTVSLLKYYYKLQLPTFIRLVTHRNVMNSLADLFYLLFPFGKLKSVFEILVLCELAVSGKYKDFGKSYMDLVACLVTTFDMLGNHEHNLRLYQKKFKSDYVENINFCFMLVGYSILNAYHEPISSAEQERMAKLWVLFFGDRRLRHRPSLVIMAKMMVKPLLEKTTSGDYWGSNWKTSDKLNKCETPEEILSFCVGKRGLKLESLSRVRGVVFDLVTFLHHAVPLYENQNLSFILKKMLKYLDTFTNRETEDTIREFIREMFMIFKVDRVNIHSSLKKCTLDNSMLSILETSSYSTRLRFVIFSVISAFYTKNAPPLSVNKVRRVCDFSELISRSAVIKLETEDTGDTIPTLKLLATVVLKYIIDEYVKHYGVTGEPDETDDQQRIRDNLIIVNYINETVDAKDMDTDISKQALLRGILRTILLYRSDTITTTEKLADFLDERCMLVNLDRTFLRVVRRAKEEETSISIDFKSLCEYLRSNYGIDNALLEVSGIVAHLLKGDTSKVVVCCERLSAGLLKSSQFPIIRFVKSLNSHSGESPSLDFSALPGLFDLVITLQLIFSNFVTRGSFMWQLWDSISAAKPTAPVGEGKIPDDFSLVREMGETGRPDRNRLEDLNLPGMPISDKLVILDSIGIKKITGLVRCTRCDNVLVWYDNNCGQPTERPGMPVTCSCGGKGMLRDHGVSGDIVNLYAAQGHLLREGIGEFIAKKSPQKGFFLLPTDKKPSELSSVTTGKCFPKALYLLHMYLSSIILLCGTTPTGVTGQGLVNNIVLSIKVLSEIYHEKVEDIMIYSLGVAPTVASHFSRVGEINTWQERLKVEDKLSDIALNTSNQFGSILKQVKIKMLKKRPFMDNVSDELFSSNIEDQDIAEYVFSRRL